MTSADIDTVNQEIARQTSLLNDLRLKQAEPSVLDDVKKKLGELKRSLAALNSAAGGKDAGKRRERLLLKTAKVTHIRILSRSAIQSASAGHA